MSVRVPSAPRGAGRGSGWGGELREIRLDDGRRFCVDAEQMARLGLAPGETVDDALAARLEARDAYLRARNAAVRLLAIRPRSIAELRLRLRRTGVPETHAGAVVRDLLEAGYLDDLSFARAWIAARLRANRRGLRGLRLELREKGVAAAIIEQAIREACGEEGSAAVEARAARAIVERRLRAYAHLAPDARRRRVAGLLERRGFSSETIAQLVRRSNELGTRASRTPAVTRSTDAPRGRRWPISPEVPARPEIDKAGGDDATAVRSSNRREAPESDDA